MNSSTLDAFDEFWDSVRDDGYEFKPDHRIVYFHPKIIEMYKQTISPDDHFRRIDDEGNVWIQDIKFSPSHLLPLDEDGSSVGISFEVDKQGYPEPFNFSTLHFSNPLESDDNAKL